MRIGIHAGHNPDWKTACGAIGLVKESTENRNVKNEVIRLLKQEGHTIFDCTVDNGTSVKDIVNKQVSKSNAQQLDLTVAIHFNSGANDRNGNGNTTGVEVLVYNTTGSSYAPSKRICENISKLGYRNRGVKVRTDLGFLSNTKAQALLVECCFVDDKDDINKYNYKTMAKAIAEGILGKNIETELNTNTYYRVVAGSYANKSNAEVTVNQLKSKGYGAFIATFTKDNTLYYRAVAGSYSVRTNADAQINKLKLDGYSAFIEVYKK